ncbi:hypothetical protein Tco_0651209 [Tanacetum coccineum]
MHVFVGNFTYVIDFMIVGDIISIIDPRLSQVVLGKPFVEVTNMTHDPPEGVVRFTNRTDKIAYKMPHKVEQYNSLSHLEKEHTKSVYLRNEEDKRRGVEYAMSKIMTTEILAGACPIFFCLTGRHPSRIFSLCSAMCRGTPVISAGLQANISRLHLNKPHSSFHPSSVSYGTPGPETIVHSSGMILQLRNVTIPPATGN